MKRLAILIGLVLVLGGVTAQDRTYTLTSPISYYALPYRAVDTVGDDTDTTWYFQWLLTNYDFPMKTNVKVKIDEISGLGNCSVILRGKQFSGDAWTGIDTVLYGGAGSDTTFVITDGTARQFRYYSIYVVKTALSTGKSEVEALELKHWQTQ